MTFGIGIVGCGAIGEKRAQALGPGGRLVACADVDEGRARRLAAERGARVLANWRDLIELPEVEVVLVATPHDSLAEVTRVSAEAGKHVLVEKPAARSTAELIPVMEAASRAGVRVRVGFNHRYHRALRRAKEIFDAGSIGEVMYVRARYGHGGRVGYEREWRAQPRLSGGGELIDQGPHVIDLARWFLGDVTEVDGFAHTYFWPMPVDDNAFLLLRTPRQQVAFLHVSCTEWKNLFSMEIFGRDGKLEVSGLGGSYGVERLTCYRMLPGMGPPETTAWEYPMADDSWQAEMADFYEDIRLSRSPSAGLRDAFETLEIIEKIYRMSGLDHRA